MSLVLLPKDAPLMLPEDALASAEAHTGEGEVFVVLGRVGGAGAGNADNNEAVLVVRGNVQSSASALIHPVQRVVEDLHANLE